MKSIQRSILEHHLAVNRSLFKGSLLNAGCGDITYEFIYKDLVQSQIRFDWPNTVHDKSLIDVYGSVTDLPFADRSFDVILCTEVLEHVNEPKHTLNEFYRVLKPGGYVILSVPFLYQMHEQPYDFFRYTYYGLNYLFTGSGFKVISCKARGEIAAVLIYMFRKLVKRIASKILGRTLSEKIPYALLDKLYLKLMQKNIFDLEGSKTSYTLGYTVIAEK